MRRAWLGEPPEVSLPDPDGDPGWYGELALLYPPSTAATPMHWPHTFRAMCGLRLIMNRVAHEAFRDHHPQSVTGLPRRKALELQSRLHEWYDRLPEPLEPKRAVFPCHLRLQYGELLSLPFTRSPFAQPRYLRARLRNSYPPVAHKKSLTPSPASSTSPYTSP